MSKKRKPGIEDWLILEMAHEAYPALQPKDEPDPRKRHLRDQKRLAFIKGAKAIRKRYDRHA